jgi:hypothetical protein
MPIAGINITEDVLYAFAGLFRHENACFLGGVARRIGKKIDGVCFSIIIKSIVWGAV